MNELNLRAQSIEIQLRATSDRASQILEIIARDYAAFFSEDGSRNVAIALELWVGDDLPTIALELRDRTSLYRSKLCAIYGWGKARACDYGDAIALSKIESGKRSFMVYATGEAAARETCHSILLSAVGEQLDRLGFHRIHALGFSIGQKVCLLIGDSGVGKSSIALQLLRDRQLLFQIFSDESPLAHNGMLYSFPSRLALSSEVAKSLALESRDVFARKLFKSKLLFPFPLSREASPAPVDFVIIGRAGNAPAIEKCSRFGVAIALFKSLVVGAGVAQMAEWILRIDAAPALVRIALSRARAAWRLLASAECFYTFTTGGDARQNAEVFREFLVTRGLDRLQENATSPSI